MAEFKRQTAFACSIKQLLEGEFIHQEGWDPSYVVADEKMLVRVRIVGVLVSDHSVDDGTGILNLRFFLGRPNISVGKPVLLIGRPRQGPNGAYLVVEIAKEVSSSYLKKFSSERDELFAYAPIAPKRKESPVAEATSAPAESTLSAEETPKAEFTSASEVEPAPTPNNAEVLLNIIRQLDPGDGAPTDEVLEAANFQGAEDKLQFLIEEGEVFELRAGKIKVLE